MRWKNLNKLLILIIALFTLVQKLRMLQTLIKKDLSWDGINRTWYAWQKVYDEKAKKGYTMSSELKAL